MKMTFNEIFREILPLDSFAHARRQIATNSVLVNGQTIKSIDQEVEIRPGSTIQLGKRHMFRRDSMKWTQMIPLNKKYEYRMELGEDTTISAKLQYSSCDQILLIGADGYGDMTSADGHGWPIAVEYYEGEFRVMIWGDVNNEERTHVISLEGARENARTDEF